MPLFTFQPPSVDTGGITASMQQQAQIQAQAAQQQGQIWGQTAANIGGQLAQIPLLPGIARKQQQDEQERQMRLRIQQEQLTGAQFGNAVNAAKPLVAQAIVNSTKRTPEGLIQYDTTAYQDFLKSSGNPYAVLAGQEHLDALNKANESVTTFRAGQAKSQDAILEKVFADAARMPGDVIANASILARLQVEDGRVPAQAFASKLSLLENEQDPQKRLQLAATFGGIVPKTEKLSEGDVVATVPGIPGVPSTVVATGAPKKQYINVPGKGLVEVTHDMPSVGGQPPAATPAAPPAQTPTQAPEAAILERAVALARSANQDFSTLPEPARAAFIDKARGEFQMQQSGPTPPNYSGTSLPSNVRVVVPSTGVEPSSQIHNVRIPGIGDVPAEYVPNKNGVGGRWMYKGEDVTARGVQYIPPAITQITTTKAEESKSRVHDIAQMLVSGETIPSNLSKRGTEYNDILREANQISMDTTGKPYSPTRVQLDYEAAKKFVSSMNSDRMIRFKGLADSVVKTIDEVRDISEELKQGGVQLWNRAKRSSIQQVYGNTPQSELAARYVGAVNTLKEEFANLANGGYAPTDAAWKLSNDQINGDFGVKDLAASLVEVRRLINFRQQSFNELSPTKLGGNDTTPRSTPPPQPQTNPFR
jgi:hypothetical protein